jgi:hypothetical protein
MNNLLETFAGFSNHTDNFLASCAVVVSSLLPPFAKTMNKSTGYVISEHIGTNFN